MITPIENNNAKQVLLQEESLQGNKASKFFKTSGKASLRDLKKN